MAEIPLAAMKAVAERLDGLGLDYAFLGGSSFLGSKNCLRNTSQRDMRLNFQHGG
jgi:hypothetical protein